MDAESIASEEELVPLRIPDREGEDAVQPLQHRPAVLAVGREQHFRIALGTEAGPVALEICTELLEVVELAVVDDPVPSVRIRHRLSSTFGQVDDREPPVTQRGCRAAVSCRKAAKAFAVWPAMRERVRHVADELLVFATYYAAYSAHPGRSDPRTEVARHG